MARQENILFARQILVLAASCLHSFVGGIVHAFPSILNQELLTSGSEGIKATSDEASWIAASYGLSGVLGFVILSPLFQIFGRKPVNIILNSFVLIGWTIIYFANSVPALVIGRLVQGLSFGGIYIVVITLGENSHKRRRGYFMTLKKVSVASGSLVCHFLGLSCTWRQIIILGAIVSLSAILLICFCPESPAFLAMKGRFEESRNSHYYLFGDSPESQKELEEIITAQMKSIEQQRRERKRSVLLETTKKLLRKDFQRPFFIVVFATLAMDACGRYFLLAYITQILIEVTGSISISMYCSVVADILLIVALCISCVIVRLYNRRAILFKLGSASVLLMFLVSLSILIKTQFGLQQMKWLTSCLILLHSFVSHVGLVPVIFVLTAEIFPLEHKGLGSFTSGIIFSAFYSLTLKVTPLMMEKTGIGGTFAIYGVCVLVCLIILYVILPETKDRTLQEIENEIRGTNSGSNDVELVLLKSNLA